AGYAVSDEAGAVATYVKLLRVACLPVVVIAVALLSRRAAGEAKSPFPWFAVGFVAMLTMNSLGWIPKALHDAISTAAQWLLVAAIAALGMKTSLKEMASLGPRHIGVVVGATLLLLVAALGAEFII
ncbi:MAG: putative sulfate exporter family transporter, partial [Parvularculaceae bacterium]|nr:putative sulfate exporter family transporter [Parvularculaceae bacterium]